MRSVLVVDDHDSTRDILERRLTRAGCRVRALAEGREVLATVRQEHPDLVIMDVRLPDADGLELTRQLKADPETAKIPVAILTASARDEDARLAWETGCDAFLTKPFEWASLWESLQRLFPPSPPGDSR